jgi:hypothetical protein
MPITSNTHDALKVLRNGLPRAAEALHLPLGEGFEHWAQTVDHKLMPRLGDGVPLVAAICGGGSTGKSTLFNTLIGRPVSPTGGRAGLNRRVLVGIPGGVDDRTRLFDYLSRTFGAAPDPVEHPEQLGTPGDPLYCESDNLPHQMVLLDTPDIDTGARGHYTNRDLARQSLEVADLFIYIFTNATYNNLDNTDFIARMLTGMGTRPCYLVYRVYPSYSDDDVREHARTVAQNIYGQTATENVLGRFRADESNAVAAGEATMAVRSVDDPPMGLSAALARLDPMAIRNRVLASMLDDTLSHARKMTDEIRGARTHLQRYARALETAQGQCVGHALSQFPLNRVLGRFAQLWRDGDPAHIKWMRGTGRAIEWPLKTAMQTIRWIRKPARITRSAASPENQSRQLETHLLAGANRLYKILLDTDVSFEGQAVTAPALVRPAQERLSRKPWQTTLEWISAQSDDVLSWSTPLDAELKALADDLRGKMGVMDQIRQTFAAVLNVIPATAAITYILHTGDPVGAAGIKVKLTGLFGLNDLYALIAIPATVGMTKADRKQLDQMLSPLAQTWLAHKLNRVREIFETGISGDMMETIGEALNKTESLIQEIDLAMETVDA